MPAIPAIIGVGGSLIGGLLGKSKAPSAAGISTPVDPSIAALNTSLKNLADFQVGQGQTVLPKALGALGQSEDFYRTLLSGDRNAMMSLLGPQLNAIGTQGQAQQRSISELMPRGGALTDRLGNLSTQSTGQINDALLNYRPAAAQSLANVGGQYGQIATGLLGQGGAATSSGLSSLLGQRGQDINTYLAQYQAKQENDRSLGQGVGSLLGILLGPGGILNKSGSKSVNLPIRPTNWPMIIKN